MRSANVLCLLINWVISGGQTRTHWFHVHTRGACRLLSYRRYVNTCGERLSGLWRCQYTRFGQHQLLIQIPHCVTDVEGVFGVVAVYPWNICFTDKVRYLNAFVGSLSGQVRSLRPERHLR